MTRPTVSIDREKKELVMSRIFDAPRELVYKTYVEPQLISQWWGAVGTITVDKMDVRPGGAWRFVQQDSEGNKFTFSGEYREVLPPERITFTFTYEEMPGHDILETVTFEEYEGGKTKLIDISFYETLEDLEGMLQSGAEQGTVVMWQQLDTVLKTLQSSERL